jgi:hypothetical protein
VKGLFVESAPLAPRIFEMEQLLLGPYPDRVPFDWGGLAWGRPAILQGMGFLRRADRLRLLGVDTVCTDLPIQEEGLEIAGRRVDHGFTVYRLPDCPLVEPIRETPRIATGSWSREVLAWYLGTETRLLLDRAVAAAPAGQGEAVEEWSVSPRGDRIRFLTRGRAAPYLVKTAWHRNWRAWVEGRPAPIAQAAPGLMVVSGAGRFELRYGRSAPDLAALALSGAALAAWLVRTILHRPGRPGTSRRPRDGRVRPSRPFSHPPSPPI